MDIPLLDWPARSPDLNPIENLWGILTQNVFKNGQQYQSVLELKIEIERQWNEINDDILKNLINSMPQRIFQVINNSGGATKY